MYPPFSNNDSTSQAVSNMPFINNNDNQYPNCKLMDPFTSLFHSPSPYIYEDNSIFFQHFHDLFIQQQQLTTSDHNTVAEPEPTVEMVANSNNTNGEYSDEKCHDKGTKTTPRKRTSKKDRHSKINTAHGPRDRRMRLSLDVARKFFWLQDILGYDKASKTVEWLMTKSKTAINEVAKGLPQMKQSHSIGANSASSTSEIEISGVDDSAVTNRVKPSFNKEKKTRGFRNASVFLSRDKESRKKAREKARERTREKRRLGESKLCLEAMSHELNHLAGSSWSPLETGEESRPQCHNSNPFYKVLAHELEEPAGFQDQQQIVGASEEVVGDSMVITGNWSPSATFSDQYNTGISHENQFSEFQLFGKSWEAYYYNINL